MYVLGGHCVDQYSFIQVVKQVSSVEYGRGRLHTPRHCFLSCLQSWVGSLEVRQSHLLVLCRRSNVMGERMQGIWVCVWGCCQRFCCCCCYIINVYLLAHLNSIVCGEYLSECIGVFLIFDFFSSSVLDVPSYVIVMSNMCTPHYYDMHKYFI
jgi:hypothetical protein